MLRPTRGKVIVTFDLPPADHGDGVNAVRTDSGILIPETAGYRNLGQIGKADQIFGGDFRVLVNTTGACWMDDVTCVVREEAVIALILESDILAVNDWSIICPLPVDKEQTASGLYLTEKYRADRNGGMSPDTREVIQVNAGLVWKGNPLLYRTAIDGPQWVIFEYNQAVYQDFPVQTGCGERKLVEHVCVQPHALLAVMTDDLVMREFGADAHAVKAYQYGKPASA